MTFCEQYKQYPRLLLRRLENELLYWCRESEQFRALILLQQKVSITPASLGALQRELSQPEHLLDRVVRLIAKYFWKDQNNREIAQVRIIMKLVQICSTSVYCLIAVNILPLIAQKRKLKLIDIMIIFMQK